MPGTPKPPGARRRRNAGQAQWKQLPADGRSRSEMPELPGEDWLDSTIAWWNTIWTSPMATAWVDADIDSILRLAHMRDEFHRDQLPVSAFGAMQALEDRFGLSPRARRALQWEISKGEEVIDLPQKGEERRLRAVEA